MKPSKHICPLHLTALNPSKQDSKVKKFLLSVPKTVSATARIYKIMKNFAAIVLLMSGKVTVQIERPKFNAVILTIKNLLIAEILKLRTKSEKLSSNRTKKIRIVKLKNLWHGESTSSLEMWYFTVFLKLM